MFSLNAIKIYEELYNELNHSGNFLINYGGVLSLNKEHNNAIKILEQAKAVSSEPNLYIALGNSYKEVGKLEKAIESYNFAYNIIPHKLYPRYLIANLYKDNNMLQKAKEIAREIINTSEKIPSTAVLQIKNEMKKILISQ